MTPTRLGAIVVLLLIAGCTGTEATRAPPAYSGPSWFDQNGVLHGFTERAAPPRAAEANPAADQPFTRPLPEVPQIAPPIEGSPETHPNYQYQPGASPPSGAYGIPLNPGPVTGFGAGGMVQPPGARPNPPFHF